MRKLPLRTPFGAALLLLAGSSLLAQPSSTFSETTSTVVVEVPVQVLRDGEPVRGLTAADFEVYDGRRRQQVIGFEVVDLSTTSSAAGAPSSPAARPVPAAGRRHFLLLFDLAFSEARSIVKARAAAADVVAELHATDLVAVATYHSLKGPQLVLGFTPDRAQIAAAVASLGAPEMLDRTPDPLRLMIASNRAAEAQSASLGGGRAGASAEVRAGAAEAATELLQSLADASARAQTSAQRAVVTNFTRAMADLGKMMGSVLGRKYVVYLSEGFDPSLVEGTNDQARRDEMAAATQSGEVWNASSEELYGDTRTLNEVERMLEELRRADCVVQAVDIGGLRAEGELGNRRTSGTATLLNFAKSTGGELFENFNDLSEAMGQMLTRTSITYVLSFQPADLDWNGAFHRLRVEVKNQPRGTRVVHRPGYYAPVPYVDQQPLEKVLDAATMVVAGEDSGELEIAVLAAPFAMPAENAYVPVLVEVGGRSLLGGNKSGTLPAEVYVYAFDAAGKVQDYVSQVVSLDLGKLHAALQQSGMKFFGHLELPPGDYSIRVLVRNGASGQSGLRSVPMRVPAFAESEAALLPPFFPEPPDRWLLSREAPRGDYQQADYPFMQQQRPYIPSSRPTLAPGEEAAVSLVAYNLGSGELRTAAKVLADDGRELAPAAISILRQEGSGTPLRLAASIKPPKLEPGHYRLEVRITGPKGTHSSSTPFVVARR